MAPDSLLGEVHAFREGDLDTPLGLLCKEGKGLCLKPSKMLGWALLNLQNMSVHVCPFCSPPTQMRRIKPLASCLPQPLQSERPWVALPCAYH